MSARPSAATSVDYALLYRSSQESLSAMAARHTQALARVLVLRNRLLAAMKRTHPAGYAAAEQQMGHTFGQDTDDEVLLAYLDAFMGIAPEVGVVDAVDPGMLELRQALTALGVHLGHGDDPSAWATAVRQQAAAAAATGTTPAPPSSTPGPASTPAAAPARVPARAEHVGTVHDGGAAYEPTPLDQLDVPWDEPGEASPPGPQDLFSSDEPSAPAAEWDLSHLFDDVPGPAAPAARVAAADDAQALVDDLFGDDEAPLTPAICAPEEPAPAQVLPVPVPVTPAPAAAAADTAPARTAGDVIRPGMFPPSSVPRPARSKARPAPRTPRVSALPPEPEPTAAAPVATERFSELLDVVAQPRPVFLRDLVAACGSPGLVSAWEQAVQDEPGTRPVRFITSRAHHRERGSLVVPDSAELRTRQLAGGSSVWTECLDDGPGRARLRGARLYETGVLLHRFGDQVVSHKLTADTLTLRLNAPEGLTGVVLWIGADSPAGPRRSALVEAVGELIKDRLVRLAVLTTETGPRATDRLAGIVGEDAAAAGWAPAFPVVVSHSWDFADDSGASALQVL